jgi:chaperonin cofactor prefoldin
MSEQRKKTKRSTETLTSRVRKVELTFKEIESQLKEAISKLEARAERFQESEQRISGQIIDLQNQIRQNMPTGPNPENLITLEEGYAVNLEELEKRMEEKYSLLAERERELQELQKRISAEFEGVRTQIKERDLLLGARENLLRNQGGSKKRGARLVSFFVDIGKKQ